MGRTRRRAKRARPTDFGDKMDYASCRSLPAMFFEAARQKSGQSFLWAKRDGKYRPLLWSETADAVERLARGLLALGIAPGDRVAHPIFKGN